MSWIFLLAFWIYPALALAGSEGGIPYRFVFFQIFNFTLFAFIVFYLARKKLPEFLQRQKSDFLEYKSKAYDLEKKQKSACLLWEEKVQALVQKEKNIDSDVAQALNRLKTEWEIQEKESFRNLKVRLEQELKRERIKALNKLKNRLLSSVMKKTKQRLLELSTSTVEKLNYQMIQKWKKM